MPAGKPDDFNINTADELLSLYRKITTGIFGLMVGVTALSLVVGGIIGMGLGFLMAWGVSHVIKLPAAVSWWSILLGFGFSAFVGAFFGWYPASRAAKLSPIEALRHE